MSENEFYKKKLFQYQDINTVIKELIKNSGLSPRIKKMPTIEAIGLYAAKDIVAEKDKPEWNQSLVDGYAIISMDTDNASKDKPIRLKIIEKVDPREAGKYTLKNGETVYVDTGFPLPKGANATIPIETAEIDNGYLLVKKPVKPYENTVPKGTDIKKGENLVSKGEKITGLHTRVLLDAGVHEVTVYSQPKITVFPIGDELMEPWETPVKPGQVNETTRYVIKHFLEKYPVNLKYGKILPDNPEKIVEEIMKELRENRPDIIVTISGVSLGRKDYSWITLKEKLKPKYAYRGVKIHPGRTNSGMALEGTVIINLPGFIQSSMAGILFILLPLVRYMNGKTPEPKLACETLVNEETFSLGEEWSDYYKIRYVVQTSRGMGRILDKTRGPMTATLIKTSGITIMPPGKNRVEKGEEITVYKLLEKEDECSII